MQKGQGRRSAFNIAKGGGRPAWRMGGWGYRPSRPCRPGGQRFSLRAPSLRLFQLQFAPASVMIDEYGTNNACDDALCADELHACDSGGALPAWLDSYGSNAAAFSDHSFQFRDLSSRRDDDDDDESSPQCAAPPPETEERCLTSRSTVSSVGR